MSFPYNYSEMKTQGYAFLSMDSCRGCGRAIEFWRTPAGKSIPMDPMDQPDSPAISHFATCTKASQFRRTTSKSR